MNTHVRNFEAAATDQMNEFGSSSKDVAGGITKLVEQNLDFAKRATLDTASFLQVLLEKRTMSDVIQAQTEFASRQNTALLDQWNKVAGIYQQIANEAVQPLVSAATKAQTFAERSAR